MSKYQNLKSFDPRVCISGKISRIARVTASIFRNYMAPFGVTNSQVSLLFILSKHDRINQKSLAAIAKLEKSSLHRNLKKLVKAGYVKKVNFPFFKITTEGKQLVNDIIPEWEKAMSEIRNTLSSKEESYLTEIHDKLVAKKD